MDEGEGLKHPFLDADQDRIPNAKDVLLRQESLTMVLIKSSEEDYV